MKVTSPAYVRSSNGTPYSGLSQGCYHGRCKLCSAKTISLEYTTANVKFYYLQSINQHHEEFYLPCGRSLWLQQELAIKTEINVQLQVLYCYSKLLLHLHLGNSWGCLPVISPSYTLPLLLYCHSSPLYFAVNTAVTSSTTAKLPTASVPRHPHS